MKGLNPEVSHFISEYDQPGEHSPKKDCCDSRLDNLCTGHLQSQSVSHCQQLNNSPIQDCVQPDDQTQPTYVMSY